MEVMGGMFFCAVNLMMANTFNTLMVFCAEKPIVNRELANQMYTTFPYFFVK